MRMPRAAPVPRARRRRAGRRSRIDPRSRAAPVSTASAAALAVPRVPVASREPRPRSRARTGPPRDRRAPPRPSSTGRTSNAPSARRRTWGPDSPLHVFDEEVRTRRRPVAGQDREEAAPVGRRVRDPRGVGDRRGEVDVQREHARELGPRRPLRGVPSHHERHADRLLVRSSFLVHRCSPCRMPLSDVNTISVFSSRPARSSASRILPSARSTPRSDRYWSARNASIAASCDGVRGGGLGPTPACRRPPPRRRTAAAPAAGSRTSSRPRAKDRRGVRRRGGELEEQRSGRVLHERDGLVRQHLRRVVVRTMSELAERPVDRQGVIHLRRAHERHPPVPAGWDVAGHRRVLVTIEVLAEEPRSVAGIVQPRRERRAVVEPLEPAERRDLPVDEGRVRVVAGEDAGPARAAERVHDERVRERHAPSLQALGQDRHRPQGIEALIVGHDENDVREDRGRGRLGPPVRAGRTQDQERPEGDRRGSLHAPRYVSRVAASRDTSASNAGSSATFVSS